MELVQKETSLSTPEPIMAFARDWNYNDVIYMSASQIFNRFEQDCFVNPRKFTIISSINNENNAGVLDTTERRILRETIQQLGYKIITLAKIVDNNFECDEIKEGETKLDANAIRTLTWNILVKFLQEFANGKAPWNTPDRDMDTVMGRLMMLDSFYIIFGVWSTDKTNDLKDDQLRIMISWMSKVHADAFGFWNFVLDRLDKATGNNKWDPLMWPSTKTLEYAMYSNTDHDPYRIADIIFTKFYPSNPSFILEKYNDMVPSPLCKPIHFNVFFLDSLSYEEILKVVTLASQSIGRYNVADETDELVVKFMKYLSTYPVLNNTDMKTHTLNMVDLAKKGRQLLGRSNWTWNEFVAINKKLFDDDNSEAVNDKTIVIPVFLLFEMGDNFKMVKNIWDSTTLSSAILKAFYNPDNDGVKMMVFILDKFNALESKHAINKTMKTVDASEFDESHIEPVLRKLCISRRELFKKLLSSEQFVIEYLFGSGTTKLDIIIEASENMQTPRIKECTEEIVSVVCKDMETTKDFFCNEIPTRLEFLLTDFRCLNHVINANPKYIEDPSALETNSPLLRSFLLDAIASKDDDKTKLLFGKLFNKELRKRSRGSGTSSSANKRSKT